MKVENGRGVGPAGGAKRAGGAAAPGFALANEESAPTAATTSVNAVTALDAVLALQTDEPPAQRRSRQARRGWTALDALEELEKGLLSGRAPQGLRAELERLQRASEQTGEPGLDGVLREIDTRLAVELAKLERQAAA
jgi:hypothetical protein